MCKSVAGHLPIDSYCFKRAFSYWEKGKKKTKKTTTYVEIFVVLLMIHEIKRDKSKMVSASYWISGKVWLALLVRLFMQWKIRMQNSLPWDVTEAKRHKWLQKGIKQIIPSMTIKHSYLDAASSSGTPWNRGCWQVFGCPSARTTLSTDQELLLCVKAEVSVCLNSMCLVVKVHYCEVSNLKVMSFENEGKGSLIPSSSFSCLFWKHFRIT